jgi:hypothetical protein
MIVVGGSYAEGCIRPADRRLRGSGLRAAIALRGIVPDLVLLTSVSESESVEFEAVTGAFGLDARAVPRDSPVTFNYFTPLSPPSIDGIEARLLAPITAIDEVVLRFGMLEHDQRVKASCATLIIDPQGETRALPSGGGARPGRLAIVANEREVRRLGGADDTTQAAGHLLESTKAAAVVVKSGARGARVVTSQGETLVGPRPTLRVHPIGSGDAFSAAFAWAFGIQGADAVEAARVASAYTSLFVSSVVEAALANDQVSDLSEFRKAPSVYLASPFFGLGQEWLVDLVRHALQDLGAVPFSPLHDVGRGGPEVAHGDLDGLDRSASVLALVDGLDAGTVFEIGYAVRSGKPVVAYVDPQRSCDLTMLEGTGVEITDDLSTAVYRSIWRAMGSS